MIINWCVYEDYAIGECYNKRLYIDKEWIKKFDKIHLCGGYPAITINKKSILIHRIIVDAHKKQMIDHINRNIYDNRKCNLRIVNKSQNAMNSNGHSDRSSLHRGVYKDKENRKWEVCLWKNGKHIYHKRFNSFNEAVEARLLSENKYFGEYRFKDNPDAGEFAITPRELKEIL